jgi:hypothetical protein
MAVYNKFLDTNNKYQFKYSIGNIFNINNILVNGKIIYASDEINNTLYTISDLITTTKIVQGPGNILTDGMNIYVSNLYGLYANIKQNYVNIGGTIFDNLSSESLIVDSGVIGNIETESIYTKESFVKNILLNKTDIILSTLISFAEI